MVHCEATTATKVDSKRCWAQVQDKFRREDCFKRQCASKPVRHGLCNMHYSVFEEARTRTSSDILPEDVIVKYIPAGEDDIKPKGRVSNLTRYGMNKMVERMTSNIGSHVDKNIAAIKIFDAMVPELQLGAQQVQDLTEKMQRLSLTLRDSKTRVKNLEDQLQRRLLMIEAKPTSDTEYDVLKSELERERTKYATLKNDNDDLNDTIKSMASAGNEVKTLREDMKVQQARIVELQNDTSVQACTIVREQLSLALNTKRELENEIEALKMREHEKDARLSELNTKNASLRTTEVEKRADLNDARQHEFVTKARYNEAVAQHNAAQEQLQARIKELQDQSAQGSSMTSKLDNRVREADLKHKKQLNLTNDHKRALDAMQRRVADVATQITALSSDTTTIPDKSQIENKLKQATKDLEQATKSRDNARTTYYSSSVLLDIYRTELDSITKERDEHISSKDRVRELEAQIERMTSIGVSEAAMRSLQEDLNSARDQLAASQAEVAAYRDQANTSSVDDAVSNLTNARAELARTKTQHEHANQKLQTMTEDLERIRSERNVLRAQVMALQGSLESTTTRVTEAESQLSQLKDVAQKASLKIREVEQNSEALRHELETVEKGYQLKDNEHQRAIREAQNTIVSLRAQLANTSSRIDHAPVQSPSPPAPRPTSPLPPPPRPTSPLPPPPRPAPTQESPRSTSPPQQPSSIPNVVFVTNTVISVDGVDPYTPVSANDLTREQAAMYFEKDYEPEELTEASLKPYIDEITNEETNEVTTTRLEQYSAYDTYIPLLHVALGIPQPKQIPGVTKTGVNLYPHFDMYVSAFITQRVKTNFRITPNPRKLEAQRARYFGAIILAHAEVLSYKEAFGESKGEIQDVKRYIDIMSGTSNNLTRAQKSEIEQRPGSSIERMTAEYVTKLKINERMDNEGLYDDQRALINENLDDIFQFLEAAKIIDEENK